MKAYDGISVVIPAYNEERFLPDTLESLAKARFHFEKTTGHEMEVIVVNNNSTDNTTAVAESLGARVIHHEERNIAGVRNAGILQGRFEIIITIDADCTVEPEFLVECWDYMQEEDIIGGCLGLKVTSDRFVVKVMAAVLQFFAFVTTGIHGAVFCFEKSAARQVKGFPEQKLIAEDSAFAIRMRKYAKELGAKFTNFGDIKVTTVERKDMSVVELPWLIFIVIKAALGKPLNEEELEFWYNPDR